MRFNYGSRFCRPLELGWNVSTPVQESAVYGSDFLGFLVCSHRLNALFYQAEQR